MGAGVGVGVGVAVAGAVGVGVGVADEAGGGDGTVATWAVELALKAMFVLPPKNAAMSGVRSWKWPVTVTVVVFPIPLAQELGEQDNATSAGWIETTVPLCASSWTRHITVFWFWFADVQPVPEINAAGVREAWKAPSRAALITAI